MNNFIISTTHLLDGVSVKAYLDVVNINVVIGTNIFSDFAASVTDFFGGSSETYQNKLNMMYENAKTELSKITKRMGGNAILGFRADFEELSGKGKSMFMLTASGTACLVDYKNDEETSVKNEHQIVSKENLDLEVTKQRILQDLISGEGQTLDLSDKDWNFLWENPSKEIIEIIVKKYFIYMSEDEKVRTESLVKSLEYEDACELVYPLYINERLVKDTFSGEMIDLSDRYKRIISKCDLLNPSRILELMDNHLDKILPLLNCEKQYYDQGDLKSMGEICHKFDLLPNLGEITTGKTGMFSKEKELFICRNGHKNEKEIEYCSTCGENIKGLQVQQIKDIMNFKKRVEALGSLLS